MLFVLFECRSVPIVGTDLTHTEPNGPLYLSDGTLGLNTQVCESRIYGYVEWQITRCTMAK